MNIHLDAEQAFADTPGERAALWVGAAGLVAVSLVGLLLIGWACTTQP